MSARYIADEWKVIERGFNPDQIQGSESLFSLGNAHMGHRGNFEESYSGQSLQGSYVAGVYYPDKTRVGWWKNGYPEYFAKVLNSINWIKIRLWIDDEEVDLAKQKVIDFKRELDMKSGTLKRDCELEMSSGKRVRITSLRFCSLATPELGAVRFEVELPNDEAEVKLQPSLDFDVHNEDSNYGDYFWKDNNSGFDQGIAFNSALTKKTEFQVFSSMEIEINNSSLSKENFEEEKCVGTNLVLKANKGEKITLDKYCSVLSSFNYSADQIADGSRQVVLKAREKGFDALFNEHSAEWGKIWEESDIKIEGDVEAQQGIRFNIFHLFQTYRGEDPRMNIGPKGFTGEKYGGSTYWDTEAYCIPFYLGNSDPKVSRQLLVYRFKHLEKAIENAEKLGFSDGAALYPMVTMNGEECHNEWEITFEEIHRNGAIAYAINRYIEYTGDRDYLAQYGLPVVAGIARFWMQRMNFSEQKGKWVILGVTGPNEYENNVNNNWYTNHMATWCLGFAIKCWDHVKTHYPEQHKEFEKSLKLDRQEVDLWAKRMGEIYFPVDEKKEIFLQQDNFLDKEILPADQIPKDQQPINQHWSWDRILRSCYIKQADVLQGMYFFFDDFSTEELQKNFDFYEPITVHESSLSPCIHSVLAARLKREDKAYELYLRTARLDLDDFNKEVHEGLHITSMAGTWISVVEGFGGYHVSEGRINFDPILPKNWNSLEFQLRFRGRKLLFRMEKAMVKCELLEGEEMSIVISRNEFKLKPNSPAETQLNQ